MEFFPDIPRAARASPTRTLFQLPEKGSWFENLAIRPSGEILVTRIDTPELWSIHPGTREASVLATFSDGGSRSLMGIVELSPDLWAIGVGYYDHHDGGARDGSWSIWLFDLTGSRPQKNFVTAIPEAGMINGLGGWDADSILAADSMHGAVFHVNVRTGKYTAIRDDSMAPPPEAPIPMGINGVHAHQGYVYYSNTMKQCMFRMPIAAQVFEPRGPVELVATGVVPDDFCFDEHHEGVIYLTGNVSNVVSKITLQPEGSTMAAVETFAGEMGSLEVAGATACAFGRSECDRRTLYVVTCGGSAIPVNGQLVEGAKVVAIDVLD